MVFLESFSFFFFLFLLFLFFCFFVSVLLVRDITRGIFERLLQPPVYSPSAFARRSYSDHEEDGRTGPPLPVSRSACPPLAGSRVIHVW
jgi:hypothetical protein